MKKSSLANITNYFTVQTNLREIPDLHPHLPLVRMRLRVRVRVQVIVILVQVMLHFASISTSENRLIIAGEKMMEDLNKTGDKLEGTSTFHSSLSVAQSILENIEKKKRNLNSSAYFFSAKVKLSGRTTTVMICAIYFTSTNSLVTL